MKIVVIMASKVEKKRYRVAKTACLSLIVADRQCNLTHNDTSGIFHGFEWELPFRT